MKNETKKHNTGKLRKLIGIAHGRNLHYNDVCSSWPHRNLSPVSPTSSWMLLHWKALSWRSRIFSKILGFRGIPNNIVPHQSPTLATYKIDYHILFQKLMWNFTFTLKRNFYFDIAFAIFCSYLIYLYNFISLTEIQDAGRRDILLFSTVSSMVNVCGKQEAH